MAVKSTAVSVGTSATRLDTAAETDHDTKSAVATYNNHATATIFVGGSDVTTANGFPVAAGTYGPTFSDLDWNEGVYGIVAASTAEMRVLETGI